jgi:hypothetical protein
MPPWLTAAVLTAVAIALGGCGGQGGPALDGPLGSGSNPEHGSVCVPGRVGVPQTFGLSQFTNHGHLPVVLDRVTLQDPHHLRLIGSYAVPGAVLVGVPGNWPPKYAGIPSAWYHRQPVHGFRLAPRKTFNMVLGAAATTAGHPTSRGMLVYYHDSSGSYVTRANVGMTIGASKSGCN